MTKVILPLVLLLFPCIALPQFVAPFKVISPIEDTWVDEENPTVNHGDSKGHECARNNDNKNKEIYLKYNIVDLPGHDSIVLSFHAGFSSYDNSPVEDEKFVLQLYPVSANWNEHDITWKNKPPTEKMVLDEITMVNDIKNYSFSSGKLQDYIESQRKEGNKEISFVIKGKNNVDGVIVWMHGKYWGYLNLECYYNQSKGIDLQMNPSSGCFKQDGLKVTLLSGENSEVYYTLDGSLPSMHSRKYTSPLPINKDVELTAIASQQGKKSLYYRNFYAVNTPGKLVVNINAAEKKSLMQNFWNATGFSPAEILLHPEMQQACDYMGAVPNHGLVYVRPHYFLNLLAVENIDTSSPIYNWSRLDSAMDVLIENGLKPIFEIMGTPSSNLNKFSAGFDKNFQAQTETHETFFTNFHEREKVVAWKRLVRDLVVHFIERYGLHEVRSWYFESVNEPDYTSFWNHTEQEYLNYYDACSEALLEVDPIIPFGGPGTAGGLKSKYLKLLLAHCDTGINYFTGEKGSRIDFISIHVKDDPRAMVEKEIEVINWIKQHHPRFSDLPFVNDEADPISGWRTGYWWRSTPWHAAFIAQSVDLHYSGIIEGEKMKYAILSNDNAFLGNWLHRTQFARFSKDGEEGFSFVKKPAFTVFTMLSLLGNTVLQSHSPVNLPADVGVLPTMHRDGKIAMLLYNKAPIDIRGKKRGEKENILLDCGDEDIKLQVKNLPDDEYVLIMYRIDDNHGNPHKVWQEMGAPDLPSNAQLDILRENQEIYIERMPGTIKTSDNGIDEIINLPASSVSLILLVPKDIMINQPNIRGLWINKYENLHGGTDYMIRWECPGHNNVLTYEVWYSEDNENFRKVNPTNFIDKGYLYSPGREINEGYLKVRAIDYWGNNGPFSQTVIFNK